MKKIIKHTWKIKKYTWRDGKDVSESRWHFLLIYEFNVLPSQQALYLELKKTLKFSWKWAGKSSKENTKNEKVYLECVGWEEGCQGQVA
jgi:hypothetical protein